MQRIAELAIEDEAQSDIASPNNRGVGIPLVRALHSNMRGETWSGHSVVLPVSCMYVSEACGLHGRAGR